MTTLAEHIIVAGDENRPPMLEKSMYDSWASRICLFIKGKKHGRMMLDSIDNGLLVYPTIKEDGQTRTKKYSELTELQQLQDDYDQVQVNTKFLNALPPEWSKFVTDATIQDGRVTVQQVQGRQNQSFDGNGNRESATNSRRNYVASQPRVVKCYNCQREGHMTRQCTQPKRPWNTTWFKEKLMLAKAQEVGQILDEEQLGFLANPRIEEALVA
ncbi:retrovirus-related pol polyprotein from transposon TNT 1-94 [Tanacetum coccineum]